MTNSNSEEITLKTLRQSLDISQEQLARRVNVSFRSISDWETKKSIPRIDNAALLARELGVSLKTLYRAFGIDITGIPDDCDKCDRT